jgi:apolipoprotein D and lipocalin family protein
MKVRSRLATALLAPALSLLGGCQGARLPELQTVAHVDLPRFMGDWYVIANIPTFIERGAHNAVERYTLQPDGSIATTFTFRADSFDGKRKRYTPRGFVVDRQTNATWGMRFVWPIKADYRITYVDPDYRQTVVSRQKRDYVWIMARSPQIRPADYARLLELVAKQGYDVSKLRMVPQQWPDQ